MTGDITPTLATALACWANDVVTIPLAPGTDKRPAHQWKQYQTERPTLEQVKTWFEHNDGIGIVTGPISGNLTMLELEGRVTPTQHNTLNQLATDTIPELWQRLTTTWTDQSPSGGVHYYLRLTLTSDDTMPRNTKIARSNNGTVLAETRAAGGFSVIAPTPGTYHPTGTPWTHHHGSPATINTFTLDELATLTAVIHAALDETPDPTPTLNPIWNNTPHTNTNGDLKPGDDYENRTDWADILTPHGWTHAFTHGNVRYWTRPGKTHGISATTGHATDRDRLYVFTSSTTFEPETPYTKFGAYSHLNHHDDHTAAARHLANTGYGHRAERQLAPVTPITKTPTPDTTNTPTHGALALKPATITSNPDQLTDAGNADLIATSTTGHLTYIPDAGRWAAWTGTRWQWAPDTAPAMQAALATIRAIPTDNPELNKHRTRSLGTNALNAAITILKTNPTMRATADTFDARPLELNTPHGIVNLETGTLTPPDPTHWHSKTTTTTPDHNGCPRWDTFILWAMRDRPTLARYLQQLAGVSLLGEIREPILPFLHGKGANGKSVFLEVLRDILGDYAVEAPNGLLIAGPKEHDTQFARLQGARVAILSEINPTSRFDEAKLKQLTGGDTFAARFMRGDFFDITPSHTFWLAANHKPTVQAGGDSFWRRVRIIPFENQIPKNERNENLKTELLEEAPGILQWMIDGLTDYLTNGLTEPEEVTAATREYAEEEDHLGRFFEDTIQRVNEAARVNQTELRNAYRAWCRSNDETELNATQLGRELKTRFDITTSRSHGTRYYTGIMLLNQDDGDRQPHWSDR